MMIGDNMKVTKDGRLIVSEFDLEDQDTLEVWSANLRDYLLNALRNVVIEEERDDVIVDVVDAIVYVSFKFDKSKIKKVESDYFYDDYEIVLSRNDVNVMIEILENMEVEYDEDDGIEERCDTIDAIVGIMKEDGYDVFYRKDKVFGNDEYTVVAFLNRKSYPALDVRFFKNGRWIKYPIQFVIGDKSMIPEERLIRNHGIVYISFNPYGGGQWRSERFNEILEWFYKCLFEIAGKYDDEIIKGWGGSEWVVWLDDVGGLHYSYFD